MRVIFTIALMVLAGCQSPQLSPENERISTDVWLYEQLGDDAWKTWWQLQFVERPYFTNYNPARAFLIDDNDNITILGRSDGSRLHRSFQVSRCPGLGAAVAELEKEIHEVASEATEPRSLRAKNREEGEIGICTDGVSYEISFRNVTIFDNDCPNPGTFAEPALNVLEMANSCARS